MRTLGERIRTLRKERKMTLESCAGEQMTKGMLSLIENNKANPSMENLNYLAKCLDVEVSELLEEVSGSELRALLDQAEKVVKSEDKNKYEETLEMIEPLVPKLLSGYTAGRLLEIYSKLSYLLGRSNWQPIAERASDIYEELNIVPRRAAVGIFWAMVLFTEHRYEEALARLLEEKAEVESRSGYIDSLTRLDLYTYEVIFRFAVNDTDEATRLMNEAIRYSKDKKIFYQVEQLYRLAAYRAIIDEDDEKLDYYERKLLQYGEFAEDDHANWFTKLVRIHQLNSFRHDHETALEKLSELTGPMPNHEFFTNFFVLERGKALYGVGRYQEGLNMLQQVVISENVHHPYDLSMYYEKDAYAALCAEQLGDLKYAQELARTADSNMAQMPDTPYTQFVSETVERLAAH
ncbi:helix-turn-helix domain-containing protein [Sporosarcina aquimarina]|uniref:helix-turn-helix domain-containing protein n=1 Tax=Sporosarcina aquimarina TaxID=114975 RepID=UPI00203F46F5|nr:helix-turn-helix transcriptional regulator [Sporosarcina aquimarina]MCM3758600.1 helix-turn-helix domain-containing protein [Sporosarcina aquimarina]